MSGRLAVVDVSKRFATQRVLSDVSLDVEAGQVHALVGHNGSGKSTLVKILAGYHAAERGARAWVDGEPFKLGDPDAAYERGLRFVHQDLGLVEGLDAVDNIFLGNVYPRNRWGRIDWTQARREAAAVLEELGYSIDVRRPVGALSLAQRTGVALARALYQRGRKARLLVLDEATSALPSTAVSHLFQVIRRLTRRGLSVVYISHNLEEVLAIGDWVTVLRDGHVVAVEDVAALDEARLVERMVGSPIPLSAGAARSPSSAEVPALRVRELSAGAIRGLDLDVAVGEIVGVTGVAGSGRDELAAALFGSEPRRGEVAVLGRRVPPGRPDRSIALGLGLLPTDRGRNGLFPEMSVRDNLTLPILPTRAGRLLLDKRREADADTWLDELGIRPRDPTRRMRELSGGNQQKVLLARWLRARPKVLILDEPTQGVDVETVDHIHRLIQQAAAEGMSFVVCSSDTEELRELSDRIVVLYRGREQCQLTGPDITREAIDTAALMFTEVAS